MVLIKLFMNTCRYLKPEETQTDAPSRPSSTCLSLLQIDGTADFTFDLLGDQSATNSHLGMPLYDGHVDEDWVSVVVHVTEELTGDAGPRFKGPG